MATFPLPWKSHGQRSLVSYIPWGHRVRYDLVTKQQQHFVVYICILFLSVAKQNEYTTFYLFICGWTHELFPFFGYYE